MSTHQNVRNLMRRFERAMNTRELDMLDELISPNVVRHCEATPGLMVTNLDQLKDFLRADASVFPDNKQTFEHILVDGNMVAMWATYEGTQMGQMGPFPPSNRNAKFNFGGVLRIENGKIAEWWVTWDNMSILSQLGHLHT
jgi:predicted ester cyclase